VCQCVTVKATMYLTLVQLSEYVSVCVLEVPPSLSSSSSAAAAAGDCGVTAESVLLHRDEDGDMYVS